SCQFGRCRSDPIYGSRPGSRFMPETKLSLARQWASRLIQPPLLVRATPYPSAQRLARLAENREGILRGPDQPRLDRADQGVVEEPLGLGADRLRLGPRPPGLRDEGPNPSRRSAKSCSTRARTRAAASS